MEESYNHPAGILQRAIDIREERHKETERMTQEAIDNPSFLDFFKQLTTTQLVNEE